MVSKKLLEFASKNYDFDINTLEHMPRNNGKIMNQIYTFYKDDKKYVLKFEPPSAEHNNHLRETRAAMDFHYYLSKNNTNVSAPSKAINGELVLQMQDSGIDYIVTAFTWLNGQLWGYTGSNAKMSFNWGKAMGDIHRTAKDYMPPNENDVQKDIFNSHCWGSLFDDLKAYPSVYKITQELLGEITALPQDRDSFGVIHGDMHQGNIFIDGDEVNIIDFGDSICGWFALDVAISLCHALWWGRKDNNGKDFTNIIIENFINGYLSANQLSDYWISKIPLFMKYRHICMNPEKNLDCSREKWIYNIENDILFDDCTLKSISDIIEKATLKQEILIKVLTKMFETTVIRADYQTKQLQGGTIGDVRLVTGIAETDVGAKLPYKVVFKTHKKYERFGDSDSWRREYELYMSDFSKAFIDSFRWPECYHAEINDNEFQIWMEYIDGVSGSGLTVEMLEQAAAELGRFQGRIYRQPEILKNNDCLGDVDCMEKDYYQWHKSTHSYEYRISEECRMPEHIKQMYRDNKDIINHEKTVEYNCLRFLECDIPVHLKQMLFDLDENKETLFNSIKRLPVVLCHRDFWIENIFISNDKLILIDWDTTGWGYMGEDIASLIFDDIDLEFFDEYYRRLVPAYLRGLSEYMDVSVIEKLYIQEMILIKFGYRIIQNYMFTKSQDVKNEQITALQKIYETGNKQI